MESEEELGIEAIIFLQGLVGVIETPEQARIGWNKMTVYEKANTLAAYEVIGIAVEKAVKSPLPRL